MIIEKDGTIRGGKTACSCTIVLILFAIIFTVIIIIVRFIGQNPVFHNVLPQERDKNIKLVDVSGLTGGITAIAAGGSHTCALTTSGGVKCWGANNNGQLGDGTNINRATPADVSGLVVGVSAIATGGAHTCVLTSSGGVKCWGANNNGQLGDGTTMDRNMPVDVIGLSSGITYIVAGGYHTCALTDSGEVKCWGGNNFGQLGIIVQQGGGESTISKKPVDVIGLTNEVTTITAGGSHTCALTSLGGVKCWGSNNFGELGDGTTLFRSIPVDVSGLTSGSIAISAGESHTCALTESGGIKCWGSNYEGALGDGTTNIRYLPIDVIGLTNGVTAIAAGGDREDYTCALTSAGGVKCWGAYDYGQEVGGPPVSTTPLDVSGLTSGVTAIAAGGSHTCVLTTSGGVKCWGNNLYGQLGDGTNR